MRTDCFPVAVLLIAVVVTDSVACDDNPAAVNALRTMGAELKVDKDGSVIYVDVSERDDINDDVLVHLSGLPQLRRFHAIYTRITGVGLKHLRKAKHLETLDLYACPITDEGLRHLKHLSQLRHVNLVASKVTDESVELLVKWKKLKYLGVGASQISCQGIRKLEEALSNCEVD